MVREISTTKWKKYLPNSIRMPPKSLHLLTHSTKVTFWTSWAYGITRPPLRFEAVWETCPRDVKGCQPWPMPSRWKWWKWKGLQRLKKHGGVVILWIYNEIVLISSYIYEECPNSIEVYIVFVTDCFLKVVDRQALLPRGAEHYIDICHVPPTATFQWSSHSLVGFHSCCMVEIITVINRWPKSPVCAVILWLFVIISPLCIPISIQCPKRGYHFRSQKYCCFTPSTRQVVAGLRQFIQAIYADNPGATTIEEPWWWRFGCVCCD